MAEIHIEKKRNRPLWPWVLAIIVVIAIVWIILDAQGNKRRETAAYNNMKNEQRFTKHPIAAYKNKDRDENLSTSSQVNPKPPQADKTREFVYFVNDKNIQSKMGTDHETTAQGLNLLSGALNDLSEGSDNYSRQINKIKKDADKIQKNPESLKHAEMVKQAFGNATKAIESIQKDKYPEASIEVNKLKEDVQQIDPEKELLQQQQDVQQFFKDAAQAVNKMEQEISG